MHLHYFTYQLPFKNTFTISGNRTKTYQPTLVVVLELGNYFGVGESPAIAYYNVSLEQMTDVLEKNRKMIEKFAFTEPQRYWHYLHHLLPQHPFIVNALDMAAWDLYGKMHKKPLYELWNTTFNNHLPVTNYTIGIDTVENTIQKINTTPWPIYKVKLGYDNDIETIQAIRNHTQATIRIDVNGGWQTEEALEKIKLLEAYNIELIEQPLHKENWQGMQQLKQVSTIPLFADESCVFENDVEKCAAYFDGINIKLTKCSGITPALRMIEKAKNLGLKVMMGNMNESSIGTAAIANFLPQLNRVDADGPLLLQQDLATGLTISSSTIALSGKYGLGITPNLG